MVEGYNGIIDTDFLQKLPGFAGSKNSSDQIAEGLATANLTVEDFKRAYNKWAYDIYCNTPRNGGMTPLQKALAGMCGRIPRYPADPRVVHLAAMYRHTLKLRPEGILFTGLNYQNERLHILRRKIGCNQEVALRYHPTRLDYILVCDPIANEWFQVESSCPEYTRNLSLYQHKLILKMARMQKVRNPSVIQLLGYRRELIVLTNQLMFSPKLRDRRLAQRASSLDAPPENSAHQSPAGVTTELEYEVDQIQLGVVTSIS